MTMIKHPTLRNETRNVPEANLEEWLAAGWLRLLDAPQRARLDEIEAEVDARYCPTCQALGDESCRTSSGAPAGKPHATRGE